MSDEKDTAGTTDAENLEDEHELDEEETGEAPEETGPPSYRLRRPTLQMERPKSSFPWRIVWIIAGLLFVVSLILEFATNAGPYSSTVRAIGKALEIDCRAPENKHSVFCARSRDSKRSSWGTNSSGRRDRGSNAFTLHGR